MEQVFEKRLRYLEYEVQLDNKGNITKKWPSERGHVMITERVADFNNSHVDRQKLWYELDEENPENKNKQSEKSEVKKQADELGIKYRDNISDEKLQEKINEFLNS